MIVINSLNDQFWDKLKREIVSMFSEIISIDNRPLLVLKFVRFIVCILCLYNMAKVYVLISVDAGSDEKVLRGLEGIGGIEESHIVLGGADLMVEMEASDMEAIRNIVYEKIRKIPEVRSTQTMSVVK